MKKIVLFGALLLSACGTVFNGTEQDISFDSNLKGVKIFVDGMQICKTPCVYPLERKSGSVVVVAKKKGYEDKQIVLRSGLNNASILNLTFWPSWLTDVATGGMWQYSRDGIYIDMEKSNLAAADWEKARSQTALRRFALFNFGELKMAAAAGKTDSDVFQALARLSGQSPALLTETVNNAATPVSLVQNLEKSAAGS